MPDNVVALPQRGKTYLTGPNRTADATGTTSKAIEGIVKVFKDLDYGSTYAPTRAPRSGGECRCILVRNASGIALTPGRVVTWKSTMQGKQVDGYARLDQADIIAGVVDEWLPAAGVADDDYFWLVVKGPCLVKKALDGTTVAKDDYVVATTAATSQATTAGRIAALVSTSNQTFAMSQALNRLGVAMSTSATTAADVLVFLDLPWA
jgi:hypothetical protein